MPSYTLRMLLNDDVVASETFIAPEDCAAIKRAIGHMLNFDLDVVTFGRMVAQRRDGFWSIEPTDERQLELPSLHDRATNRAAVASHYWFRPVTKDDVPLLRRWRARPHVAAWWGSPVNEDPEDVLADQRVAMWIVEHDGRPFAYAQDYSPHDWADHPFAHLPHGSRGIDQYIGEPDLLGCGHGRAFVNAHCEQLFEVGAPAIGTDPHPANSRAIRAYEHAGFEIVSGPLDTRWGRAVLMERWR